MYYIRWWVPEKKCNTNIEIQIQQNFDPRRKKEV